MIKFLVVSLMCTVLTLNGQETADSIVTVSPRKAAMWSLIPAGGQVYNGKVLKAGVILGLEALSIYYWQKNAANYRDYDQLSELTLPRHRYLEKRNKYAWWVGILYFYAMLDAVVDSHLMNFRAVMDEDIDKTGQPDN